MISFSRRVHIWAYFHNTKQTAPNSQQTANSSHADDRLNNCYPAASSRHPAADSQAVNRKQPPDSRQQVSM